MYELYLVFNCRSHTPITFLTQTSNERFHPQQLPSANQTIFRATQNIEI